MNQKVTISSNEPMNELQNLIGKLINWKNVIESVESDFLPKEKLDFQFRNMKEVQNWIN